MFIENMSWEEVQKKIQSDSEFILRNEKRVFDECLKRIKHLRPFPLYFSKYIKTNTKNEYLLLAWSFDGKELITTLCAVINSDRGKLYLVLSASLEKICEKGDVNIITSHFLKRYRERFLKKDVNLERVLSIYLHNNEKSLCIYTSPKDSEKKVYAINDGLALTTESANKKTIRHDTFVSDEMLGTTQREAKNRIAECLRSDIKGTEMLYYSTTIREILPYIQEIYDKYYNDCSDYLVFRKVNDDVRLNFNLKTDNEEEHKLDDKLRVRDAVDSKYLASFECGGRIAIVSERDGEHNTGKGKMFIDGKDGRGKGLYEGELLKGKPHGRGVWTFEDYRYEGEWKNGFEDGYGIAKDEDGEYIGYFKAGEKTGKGKWTFNNGYIAEGYFVDGKLNGRAKEIFPNGCWREGLYKNDRPHGKCEEHYNNGDVYSGEYKHGKKDGFGIYYFEDGRRFEGCWKCDNKNGIVKYYSIYGVECVEKYRKDVLVSKTLGSAIRPLNDILDTLPYLHREYVKFFYKMDRENWNVYNVENSIKELEEGKGIFYNLCKSINYVAEELSTYTVNNPNLFVGHKENLQLCDRISGLLYCIATNITWHDIDSFIEDLKDGYDITDMDIDHYLYFQYNLWTEILEMSNELKKM